MGKEFMMPEVSSDIREIAAYLLEVADEVNEWKQRTADAEAVAIVKQDGVYSIVRPDQKVERLDNVRNPEEVVAYLTRKGYYVPQEVAQTLVTRPRAIVPVAPVRPIRPGGPDVPTLPRELGEPERTFSEVEIYRRLLVRRWRDRFNRFTIKVLRHSKPLKNVADGHAIFFKDNEEGDLVDYFISLNAVALAFLARLDINTNYDEIITAEIVNIDTSSDSNFFSNSTVTHASGTGNVERYSMYGDGSVSLDMAIEYLVSSLATGTFSVKNIHETPIVKIPAATFKKHFTLIEADTAWTNTVVSGNKFYNVSKQVVLYDSSPSFLSFDLLGYVKATGLEESAIVFTPGQPHYVELQYAFANSEAQSVLAEYFRSGTNKTVPGLLTAEFIAIVFGA